MKTLSILLLIGLAFGLASCAMGPDWSPEVQSAAASYGGPVYAPNGTLLSTGTGGSGGRTTMFHD